MPYLLRMVEEATNHETPLILHQFSEPESSYYQTLTQNKELAQVRQDERIIRNHFNGNNWRFVELEEFFDCQINTINLVKYRNKLLHIIVIYLLR